MGVCVTWLVCSVVIETKTSYTLVTRALVSDVMGVFILKLAFTEFELGGERERERQRF